ncbi:uncharacterized protein LOC123310531 isoform X2 [Coccinella septempunctata]|uniref:uncharacterized protein LOC123310531 isoform X2 n=1 Tax=Coccinella septempunctata TaxID=41139 RepID=UPI001D0690BF|nr:uncharacterized protein LOC123310531 isoform X2 [Coccinella septempunctata]
MTYSSLTGFEMLGRQYVSSFSNKSGSYSTGFQFTGYTFLSDENGPIKYSSYRLSNGNIQKVPFGYFGPQRILGKPITTGTGPYTYFDDGSLSHSQLYHNHPIYHQGLHLRPGLPSEYSLPLYRNALYKNNLHGGNYAYSNQDGRTFDLANNSVKGAKAQKGYENEANYVDTSKGKHLEDEHQEKYIEKGAKTDNKEENSGYHSKASEAAKGSRGSSFGKSDGHRKGSKTTGYHKVHHKDEYKKEHSFYDEKDSSGHHNVYDENDSKYEKESGKFENGKLSDAGHRESEYSLKDLKDQGKYLKENDGSQREEGKSAHFENNEDYVQKRGKLYQDENGYAVSDSE